MRLILASASPRRLDLLARIGVVPDAVVPADIDEGVPKGELPRDHALRLAREKAEAVARRHGDSLVLAADTVVAVGRRILPKVEDEQILRACMKLLSGRRHRVMTGVALAVPGQPLRTRLVETTIAMKPLSPQEIEEVVLRHPAVSDAAAFRIPSERHQDAPAAAVVLREPIDLEALRSYCRERLRGRSPLMFIQLTQLPRNGIGKVVRQELTRLALAELERTRRTSG